jgi:hypothetical protein
MDVQAAKAEFKPPYDLILLDHDLGGQVYVNSDEENTGFQFCRFLTEPARFESLNDTEFVVHSWNPAGALNMLHLLKVYKKVIRQEFGPRLLAYLKGFNGPHHSNT